MENKTHKHYSELEADHWWYESRRKIIETAIEKYIGKFPENAQILDVGCGTGGNFDLINKYTENIIGLEISSYATELAKKKYNFKIYQGNLPDNVPFDENTFDAIFLLDVLEHVDDDNSSVKVLFSKLKPGGHLIITVPAFNFLWSQHDKVLQHKRRYTLKELITKLKLHNLDLIYSSYFNTCLFGLIAFIRIIKAKIPHSKTKQDLSHSPKLINKLLKWLMSNERFFIKRGSLPFGVSIIAIAQKPENYFEN